MRKRTIYLHPSFVSQTLLSNYTTRSPLSQKSSEKQIADAYKLLNVPINSKQEVVRDAFIQLAKKFHPDSGSTEADIQKFVIIENAYRFLTKHITGASPNKDFEEEVRSQIRHTVPQHRQYLSYEGVGYGTPSQREKQWVQVRAQRAANNVMEHRISKALASDNALMQKGDCAKKHDIKTKYGVERLVEDLIQESMSKGEFENLSCKGKPLKNQNSNPYVDFVTHKLNEVLINNGFTPEWIMMSKDIDHEIVLLKQDLEAERMYLGAAPLNQADQIKWNHVCKNNENVVKTINARINTFNLIVPLINKQKFHVDFKSICEDVLKNGVHSVKKQKVRDIEKQEPEYSETEKLDLFGVFFKALNELLRSKKS